jgi:GNAT superfamily N-acetyltransferase
MIIVRQVGSEQDIEHVRDLFWEYLQWANARLNEEFGIDFDIGSMVEDDMAKLEVFSPPDGRLLLAVDGAEAIGLICMRRIRIDVAEIKRMYVRPAFRGQGVGRRLLDSLIQEARRAEYPKIRLDSARFMVGAHTLYRSAGFNEIAEYPESEIPKEFRAHWIFMEKEL